MCGGQIRAAVKLWQVPSGQQILDMQTLARREIAQGWVPDRFAHFDGPACAPSESRADVQLKGVGYIPSELVTFLRRQSLLNPRIVTGGPGRAACLPQEVSLGVGSSALDRVSRFGLSPTAPDAIGRCGRHLTRQRCYWLLPG